MPIGPTAIIDKSTLQSLTLNEAEWLTHHIHPNLVEILFIEICGALTATDGRRDTTRDVMSLAKKMRGMGLTTTPNMRADELAIGNLLGLKFEMDGRIIITPGEQVRTANGKLIEFQDEPPEIQALRRWANGEFTEHERTGATMLRNLKRDIDLKNIKSIMGGAPSPPRTLEAALALADDVLGYHGRYSLLKRAFNHFKLSEQQRRYATKRWKTMGGPSLAAYAPYAYHCLRVDLYFDIALGSDLIGSGADPNHFFDAKYLLYLPFCEIFISSDHLHRKLVPPLLAPYQRFVWGQDLKDDASRLSKHYESLPEEVRRLGSMTYAKLPPKQGDFLISRLFDELRPGWRELSEEHQATNTDPTEFKKMMDEFREAESLRKYPRKPTM